MIHVLWSPRGFYHWWWFIVVRSVPCSSIIRVIRTIRTVVSHTSMYPWENWYNHTTTKAPIDVYYGIYYEITWWRHQMETFSALLAICAGNSPVPGEFPTQRPVTRSFDVFFDLRLNKRLSKQSWDWWFETLSRPLWRHRNDIVNPSTDINGATVEFWKWMREFHPIFCWACGYLSMLGFKLICVSKRSPS